MKLRASLFLIDATTIAIPTDMIHMTKGDRSSNFHFPIENCHAISLS
jgi:hypothetical protein